jgi:hypothetical protein
MQKLSPKPFAICRKSDEQAADADSKTVIGLFQKIETLEKPSVPNMCRIDRWGSGHRGHCLDLA